MEDVLVHKVARGEDGELVWVLILVVVEDVLVPKKVYRQRHAEAKAVLILVVVEDVLVLFSLLSHNFLTLSLNPCCGGRCSSTPQPNVAQPAPQQVLILVVVEDVLVPTDKSINKK